MLRDVWWSMDTIDVMNRRDLTLRQILRLQTTP